MSLLSELNCGNEQQILEGRNIHIVVLASPKSYKAVTELKKFDIKYRYFFETLQVYSQLHGYHIHQLDPIKVMTTYGGFKSGHSGDHGYIATSKSYAMLYYFKELAHTYRCEARWVLFLDIDVMVTNFDRKLESIIAYATSPPAEVVDAVRQASAGKYDPMESGGKSACRSAGGGSSGTPISHLYEPVQAKDGEESGCDVIAQLGAHTINTGVLFFQFKTSTEELLQQWVKITLDHEQRGVGWQHDQGRFQALYLHYLAHTSMRAMADMQPNANEHANTKPQTTAKECRNVKLPYNCASGPMHSKENSRRNACFAHNLYAVGLMPPPPTAFATHPGRDTTKTTTTTTTTTSSGASNDTSRKDSHQFVNRFCLLAPMTDTSAFNLHEISGVHKVAASGGTTSSSNTSSSSTSSSKELGLIFVQKQPGYTQDRNGIYHMPPIAKHTSDARDTVTTTAASSGASGGGHSTKVTNTKLAFHLKHPHPNPSHPNPSHHNLQHQSARPHRRRLINALPTATSTVAATATDRECAFIAPLFYHGKDYETTEHLVHAWLANDLRKLLQPPPQVAAAGAAAATTTSPVSSSQTVSVQEAEPTDASASVRLSTDMNSSTNGTTNSTLVVSNPSRSSNTTSDVGDKEAVSQADQLQQQPSVLRQLQQQPQPQQEAMGVSDHEVRCFIPILQALRGTGLHYAGPN